MLTFHVERWSDVLPEMMGLWAAHWEEMADEKDRIALDPDLDRYADMERRGIVHVVTARKGGELVGYHVWCVGTLLHHRTVLAAHMDVIWLRPDCRRGFFGIEMFKASERHLKSLGVKQIFGGTKTKHDLSHVYERLGWLYIERIYSKYIGSE